MLATPTKEQLTALVAAAQHGWWHYVDQLIDAEIEAITVRLIENADMAVIHECRGRIKALKEFQSLARDASKALEKPGPRAPSSSRP